MADVKEEKKKDLGEERTMTPPEPQKPPVTPVDPPVDGKKDAGKTESTEEKSTEEKKKENGADKKDDKESEKGVDTQEKDAGEKKETKSESKPEPALDSSVEQSIAPYLPSSMKYPSQDAFDFEPDNFDKDNKINLNVHKKEKESKTPIRDFIAEMCDMKGYKKNDKDKPTMSRKLAFANLIWYGAKLTVACTVFGPIAGSWLVAQYTNKEKASALESKMQNKVKFFTL